MTFRQLLIVGCSLWLGCGGAGSQQTGTFPGLPRTTPDGLVIVYSDLDGDGDPEIAKYYQEVRREGWAAPQQVLVRTEMDLGSEGQVNLWRFYDPSGAIIREDMDGDLDGRVDHRVYWENDAIVRSERDEDRDGRFDVFRYYQEGFLRRVDRDLNRDGDIDSWSYYDRQGLARVGYDTDGDGDADAWIQRGED